MDSYPSAAEQLARYSTRPVKREPAGDPVLYRGYALIPMRETFDTPKGPLLRPRWDVLRCLDAGAAVGADSRVKTCASRLTAEGWVDTFGDPIDARVA